MKKLNKEDIYINLQGKSKEELTDLYLLLKNNNQIMFRNELEDFLLYTDDEVSFLDFDGNDWGSPDLSVKLNKQEVTIQQLKEILQPMEGFRPIAMKCTREQFEAIKPKLEEIGDVHILKGAFKKYNYLTNNYSRTSFCFDFIDNNEDWEEDHKNNIHEEWNEEIFLKACGIEVETLEQQLEKAKAEVNRLEDEIEESKIKIGDWVIRTDEVIFKVDKSGLNWANKYCKKITDQELINKLNNLIK